MSADTTGLVAPDIESAVKAMLRAIERVIKTVSFPTRYGHTGLPLPPRRYGGTRGQRRNARLRAIQRTRRVTRRVSCVSREQVARLWSRWHADFDCESLAPSWSHTDMQRASDEASSLRLTRLEAGGGVVFDAAPLCGGAT